MKQKLKGGMEYDLIYGKDVHCYLQNNPKLVKWIKRRMNKRLRRESNAQIIEQNEHIS